MRELNALIAEAEVDRVLQICNACRYCEGFCAVFPAMTRRLAFPAGDIHYLANLCHHCGACLHACQYAPPHEFAVNVPRAMARVRAKTYADYAWPAGFGRLYACNGLTLALALASGLAVMLLLIADAAGRLVHEPDPGGDFYRLLSHGAMVAAFLPAFAWGVLALAVGVVRFWRLAPPGEVTAGAAAEAARAALTLEHLGGGHGQGCHEDSDRFTLARRRFHHLTFYGFMLCFAATCVATVYHYGFGWVAPYGYSSLPKLLGIAGGVGLLVGPAGLWWLHRRRHPQLAEPANAAMDLGLIGLLFGTAASGLALMVLKTTAALGPLLALHLGFVMAFFLTMPYGKFAHGAFRVAALLKWAVERRQPNRLRLGSE